MLKNLSFYVFVALLVSFAFVLAPYHALSGGAFNLSQKDISKINRQSEVESYDTSQEASTSPALVRLDWNAVNSLFGFQKAYNAIDVANQKRFCVTRIAGTCHADIRGCAEEDKQILEGLTSAQENRPILLEILPNVWIGGSLSGKAQTDLDEEKHFCLFFDQSKTHCTKLADKEHQKTVEKAYKFGKKLILS